MNVTFESVSQIATFLFESLKESDGYKMTYSEAEALAQFIVNWEESTGEPLSFSSAYDLRIQSSVTAWEDWLNDNENLIQETIDMQDLNREEAIDYMKENFSEYEQGELIDGYIVDWQ